MRITNGASTNTVLPLNIAKAYGVKSPSPPAATSQAAPIRANQVVDSFQQSSSINQLVAGKVTRGVEFSGQSNPAIAAQRAFQMYTRAADKVEAAVAVQVGRTIDLKG